MSTQTRLGHGWGCSSSRCKCRYMRRWAIALHEHRPTALGSDDDTVRLYACLPTRLVTRSGLSWTFGICRIRSQGFPHSECLHQTRWVTMRRSTSQRARGDHSRRPFKPQSQQLQPGFMSSQMTNVDFGSICNLVSGWSRKHAWLIYQ